jgi:hypothetical protein
VVTEWQGPNNVLLHQSTQAVSSIGGEMARALQLPAGNVEVKMDHIGGGFGSKFPIDRWGVEATKLSKTARRSADQADARARRRADRRRNTPLGLCPGQGRREEGWNARRVGVGVLGQRWSSRHRACHPTPTSGSSPTSGRATTASRPTTGRSGRGVRRTIRRPAW